MNKEDIGANCGRGGIAPSCELSALETMIYSGRGITVGMTPDGEEFIGYTLTGRSPPSQARELIKGDNTNTIRTSVVTDDDTLKKMFKIDDGEKLKELKGKLQGGSPALIYYPAIVPVGEFLVASNGAQTSLIYSAIIRQPLIIDSGTILGEAFSRAHHMYDQKDDRWIDITSYEPDSPNNTPRISACVLKNNAAMHIVRCIDREKDAYIHTFELKPGKGKLITTYKGANEKPLLPFTGEPLDVSIETNTAQGIAECLYAAVYGGQKPTDNYRVAAAVMMKSKDNIETAIINRSVTGD